VCGTLHGVNGDLGHVALGAWSGGRTLHFGVSIDEDRLVALLRPDEKVSTVITADAYGAGEADRIVGRSLAGLPRDSFRLVGAVGHDFYRAERDGPRGYPRFTDPSLGGPDGYAPYLRMATERSLERCGVDRFDLLLLHNPDRTGYTSEAVWQGMAALRDEGLTDAIGIAPGPANGFTLDVIDCLARFGPVLDWAMIILNPLEPWPGRYLIPALADAQVRAIARVVDYGGLFHDGLERGAELPRMDHRSFRPDGWIERGLDRIDELRPIAARHGLTPLQLACQFVLAHGPVACAAPTLIQEQGEDRTDVDRQRADLAGVPREVVLSADEIAQIAAIGDNTGSMALKGGGPAHDEPTVDRWPLDDALRTAAKRYGIVPERDLVQT
jgi:aryl-alcohol dehydrogenase-like predicted oxidoreductase